MYTNHSKKTLEIIPGLSSQLGFDAWGAPNFDTSELIDKMQACFYQSDK